MQCIATMSCHLMVSGKVGIPFTPEREIRRGDLLSPYNFMICVEYLGILINYLANQKKFGIGIKIGKDSPSIPYLMFIDDCVIFCSITKKEATMIKRVLDHYCLVSGQLMNYFKSKVQFLRNIRTFDKKEMAKIFQVTPTCNIESICVVIILMLLEE